MTPREPIAEPVGFRQRVELGLHTWLDGVMLGSLAATLLAVVDSAARMLWLDPITSRAIVGLVAGVGPELVFRLVPGVVDWYVSPTALGIPVMLVAAVQPWRPAAAVGRLLVQALAALFVGSLTLVGYLTSPTSLWVLLGLVAAAATIGWRSPTSSRGVAIAAGLLAPVIGVASFALDQRAAIARAESAGPSGAFVSSIAAYDVHVTHADAPPELLFSTQGQLYALDLDGSAPSRLDWAGDGWWERFDAGSSPMRPLATNPGAGSFELRLDDEQLVQIASPASERPAALLFDGQRDRVIVAEEWQGMLAVFDRRTGAVVYEADRSPFLGTAPWLSRDGRRLFLSSMLGDGDLQVLDLDDDLRELDRVADLFVYHTVVDDDRNLLWAGRPLYGDLLALDLETLDVRARVELATGPRDLVIDRARGQMFVNTYPAGELFRVDLDTASVVERGSCGWRCRSLAIDERRRLLWAASRDGVMMIALDRAFARK